MVNTQICSLTSAEYYQMMESGIIRAGEKVELISGSIYASIQIVTPPRSIALPQFSEIVAHIGNFFPTQKS